MSKVPMTVRGHELLLEELYRLKSVDRPNVVKAIAEARAHVDLMVIAVYKAAKEEQGFIEARFKDFEGKLSHKQVIVASDVDARGKVIFGATVVILDEGNDREMTYTIVGEDEADAKAGMISFTSPIARALIGKDEGDAIEFQAPDGLKTYDILEVRYE